MSFVPVRTSTARIGVVHNLGAGDASLPSDLLLPMLSAAGYHPCYRTTDAAWQEALQSPVELVVAVGGDGTVGQVARALAVMTEPPPLAILPVGTANNVAKALGIGGDARTIMRSWPTAPAVPFDIWGATAGAEPATFIESIGGGFLSGPIGAGWTIHPPSLIVGGTLDRALYLLRRSIITERPIHWRVELDGRDLSGDYIGVEALNIPTVGPNLRLAPEAEPGDGRLDLVLVGASDRERLCRRLDAALMATEAPAHMGLRTIQGRHLRLHVPEGVGMHLDGEPWALPAGEGSVEVAADTSAQVRVLRSKPPR